jgi:anthranilate phosphoribosyltransferase
MKKVCKEVVIGDGNDDLLDIVGTGGDGADTVKS